MSGAAIDWGAFYTSLGITVSGTPNRLSPGVADPGADIVAATDSTIQKLVAPIPAYLSPFQLYNLRGGDIAADIGKVGMGLDPGRDGTDAGDVAAIVGGMGFDYGGIFGRVSVIILGFIFIAAGLAMFKARG